VLCQDFHGIESIRGRGGKEGRSDFGLIFRCAKLSRPSSL
jgi:hypothetical protein